MITFFCYCAVEQTAILWASSYLVLRHSLVRRSGGRICKPVYFVGITVGRALGGFLTFRLSNTQMIRFGQGIILLGILCLFLPFGTGSALPGLVLIGLGCAPG